MSNDISVKTARPVAEEVIVPEVQPSGWLLFYRYPNTKHWSFTSPMYSMSGSDDTVRYPYPLFKSKDDALDAARKSLTNGGDVKLFKIDL